MIEVPPDWERADKKLRCALLPGIELSLCIAPSQDALEDWSDEHRGPISETHANCASFVDLVDEVSECIWEALVSGGLARDPEVTVMLLKDGTLCLFPDDCPDIHGRVGVFLLEADKVPKPCAACLAHEIKSKSKLN